MGGMSWDPRLEGMLGAGVLPSGRARWAHGMLAPGDGDEPFPETKPPSSKSAAVGVPVALHSWL